MAKRTFLQNTQRSIIGAAKSSAARVEKVAIRAATAAATAAAEAAVRTVLKSMMGGASNSRGRKTAAKKLVRRTAVAVTPARSKRRTAARMSASRKKRV